MKCNSYKRLGACPGAAAAAAVAAAAAEKVLQSLFGQAAAADRLLPRKVLWVY
jgi:hypothetical protein